MEKRDFWCLPLKCVSDSVFNVTYLKVLSEQHLETLKIPTSLGKFPYSHLLNPGYLLHTEVVKTRKNWILKDVPEFHKLKKPKFYSDFLKQTDLVKIILEHLHEGENTQVLQFILTVLQNTEYTDLNVSAFEERLLVNLGYK